MSTSPSPYSLPHLAGIFPNAYGLEPIRAHVSVVLALATLCWAVRSLRAAISVALPLDLVSRIRFNSFVLALVAPPPLRRRWTCICIFSCLSTLIAALVMLARCSVVTSLARSSLVTRHSSLVTRPRWHCPASVYVYVRWVLGAGSLCMCHGLGGFVYCLDGMHAFLEARCQGVAYQAYRSKARLRHPARASLSRYLSSSVVFALDLNLGSTLGGSDMHHGSPTAERGDARTHFLFFFLPRMQRVLPVSFPGTSSFYSGS
ncbi:hypothetical protein K438DRAFT_1997182 [Mycena galopus ATCC 62051]|nr:hypothetical protein K438DRAFT_1997182 [Mycena galopus ATCC 62051]